MKTYKVQHKTEHEIVFKSIADMQGFFDDVSNGSWVMIEYKEGNKKHGEVISPDISALIRDNKLTIRSEEEVK